MSAPGKKQSPWTESPALGHEAAAARRTRFGRGMLVFLGSFLLLFLGALYALPLVDLLMAFDGTGPQMRGLLDRGGLIVGGTVIFAGCLLLGDMAADPDFSRPVEVTITLVGTFVICAVSWINFWTDDMLMGWQSQILLDAIQIIFAVATLSILAEWSPAVGLLKGVRYLAGYILSAFALALPLLYATIALFRLLGVELQGDGRPDDTVKLVSAILGLPLAAAVTLLPDALRARRAS